MSGKHVAIKPVRKINTSKGVKLAAGSALALSVVIGAPTMALASPATESPTPTSTGSAFTTQDPASSAVIEAEVHAPVTLEASVVDSLELAVGDDLLIDIDPPVDPIEPPVDPTDPPVNPTDPPVDPTDPPVDPTNPPVDPTNPPVDPTNPPVQPTLPPVEPTTPPVIVPGNPGGLVPQGPIEYVPAQPVYNGAGVGAAPVAYQQAAAGASLANTGANDSSMFLAAGGLGALLLGGTVLTVGRRTPKASKGGGKHV
ncbi:LPXTG cell wall anchor domain-containing protein [Arthrobacter glacialis]|uniref:Gram-positive cocci surface proteins LPxTG domain-containing protein n=1 Tax=Arthrobacter glacialis TaxID=1664 RepID=A0A2S3ZSH6_ARTGL|nr:LPXTG cell wall anchor domain-containing protein [Arthrobacter glacialis]POH72195.1 hypothetical protein CVS27_17025 [Arthrobacter glacialis]